MGHFSDLSIDIEEADNADTSYKSDTQKILSVGDKVKICQGDNKREGVVVNIQISLDSYDKTGDRGIGVKSYDMTLGYIGSIDYVDSKGSSYWAYFNQIESIENIKDEELESDWCGTVDEDAVPA